MVCLPRLIIPGIPYHGTRRGTRRWLHADERGSIVAESDAGGQAVATYSYGPWGELDTASGGRFRYTGQMLIPELGLYYYKARFYSANLGRFLTTDPSGYGDGLNLYAYAGNDPVNATDPSGLSAVYCKPNFTNISIFGKNYAQGPFSNDGQLECQGGGGGGGDPSIPQLDNITVRYGSFPDPPLHLQLFVTDVHNANSGTSNMTGGAAGTSMPQREKSTFEKFKNCASSQLGIDDLVEAGGAIGAGLNILPTRGKFGGATQGTSIASKAASAVFGKARIPFGLELPSVVGFPLVGEGLAIRATTSLARFSGRAVPVVGWALLAYDAASIAVCTASDE